MRLKHILFTILFIGISTTLIAQKEFNNLAIEGVVKDDNGNRLTSSTVTLIQDGAKVDKVSTGKNGRFDFYLEFDHEFIVVISKSGYVTKRIDFNTKNIPEDEKQWGYERDISVNLFKEVEGVDYSILKKPIGKFYYEPNIENFVTDVIYTKSIKNELERLEDEYKEKVKDLANSEKQEERDYLLAIKDAETALSDGDLDHARDNINAAQSLKPDAARPTQLLAELNQKQEADKKRKSEYDNVVAGADVAFKSGDYQSAKNAYSQALVIVPNSSYPLSQITEVNKKLQEEASAQLLRTKKELEEKKYKDLIASADLAFNGGNFRDAKTQYQNALALKEEAYPKSQLGIIESKLADLAAQKVVNERAEALESEYRMKIDKADAAFNSVSWVAAQGHYKDALELKSREEYPTKQLVIVEQKLKDIETNQLAQAEADEKGKQYQKLIVNGDRAMKVKNYDKAKEDFKNAIELKPNESYPQEQLALIAVKLEQDASRKAQEAAQAEKLNQYSQKILEADDKFQNESYNLAATLYREAQGLNPNDDYPAQQLAKIAQLENKAKADQEKKIAFDALIKEADNAYNNADLINARVKYAEAIGVLSSEEYPKNQLAIIDQKLKERDVAQAEDKNRRSRFNEFMKRGNEAIIRENWADARTAFNEAIKVLPSEPTPMAKLKTVDMLERKARDKAVEAKYNTLVSEADRAFLKEDYNLAMLKYNEALNDKSDERYPQMRIERIKLILADLKEETVVEEVAVEKRIEEEEYEEGRSKVTIRRVIEGNKVLSYKRVVHAWGGKYFFLDDQTITELVWNRETTK